MCRDALLHRSHEIQPAFYDSEKKSIFLLFFSFFYFYEVKELCVARRFGRGKNAAKRLRAQKKNKNKKRKRHHLGSNQGPVG